jgi:hypothetical protein
MNDTPRKPGGRKLFATMIAMAWISVGYLGVVWLAWKSEVNPNDMMATYSMFVGAITGALLTFAGSNAAVHIKGKDPQA